MKFKSILSISDISIRKYFSNFKKSHEFKHPGRLKKSAWIQNHNQISWSWISSASHPLLREGVRWNVRWKAAPQRAFDNQLQTRIVLLRIFSPRALCDQRWLQISVLLLQRSDIHSPLRLINNNSGTGFVQYKLRPRDLYMYIVIVRASLTLFFFFRRALEYLIVDYFSSARLERSKR